MEKELSLRSTQEIHTMSLEHLRVSESKKVLQIRTIVIEVIRDSSNKTTERLPNHQNWNSLNKKIKYYGTVTQKYKIND